ncbi:LacI family transcriptional regulator [Mucilaginibacter sp. SG538B]|uniref:LacI family DNA-binding transcriptional regulator n=2 Tax=unclassified Mucilaginibacter TaxID=2617802 RepID=UPI0008712C7D|nr:substrate-binding domain-containing protein [Mucilaginibacter sp. SG538B]NVM62750.1 LacI family transcriptional regulator [Mucilaginibacter sp. SG538B]SCW40571.1 transcriptional regulator, LacI family [Mucilaginibacter sp. NFR10]
MMKKKISIKDIAKLTDTSITTVSFVLNGKGRISKEISKKILDVAQKNGYEPNRMAVGLRTGVSKVIGLIVESIGGPFFGEMAKVIEEEAEKDGYRIIYCSTNNNLQKGKDMIRMLSQQLVDGYIITPMRGLEKDIQNLVDNEKPVVLIDGYFPGTSIPHVLVDNYTSAYNAVDCFVRSGYKNIGMVTADLGLIQLNDRSLGYKAALKDNNLKDSSKMVLKVPFDMDKNDGVEAVKAFIEKQKQMDAVFFTTNYLGTMGLQAIKDLKLNIPDDLAVISFDDNEVFSLYPPGITTIQQPTYDIAKSAIDILMAQINTHKLDASKIDLKIPSKLIERGSTLSKATA